jgi:hypothetical protein
MILFMRKAKESDIRHEIERARPCHMTDIATSMVSTPEGVELLSTCLDISHEMLEKCPNDQRKELAKELSKVYRLVNNEDSSVRTELEEILDRTLLSSEGVRLALARSKFAAPKYSISELS